jgi:hypothetical protein
MTSDKEADTETTRPPKKNAKHMQAANTKWSPAMEGQLVELMLKYKALAKMCDGGFKEVDLKAMASVIDGTREEGPSIEAKHVKTRAAAVCVLHYLSIYTSLHACFYPSNLYVSILSAQSSLPCSCRHKKNVWVFLG